ncbi:TetR/AcrR family transcriptional regulator [Sphingomonas solaris]|uniref:TetR/AcrR family transcriptional regulator n=1 Tax=Alterirhizorhabdus solaris TaxID=2529389 RepID=A0A558RA58_9SPHN|nr:TetR family transcriptional regulator [Sphingomonas solaris]TVV76267.1 TetR/AcrR family transcriptional regulator [Sphingomonas solaris]
MTTTISPPEGGTRDAARTRENILRAAQKLFAQKGYTTTGVRQVAAEAGADFTLIRRYFGSKEGLFRAAVEDFLLIEPFITGDRATFGQRAVALLMIGEEMPSALAMMVLATADPQARILCSSLMHDHITLPLAQWLGGGDTALARAAQINFLWMAYMTGRQVLPLPALAGADLQGTRQWLADTIQAIVDG